jgi:DNA-binding transcriptional MerR regulator
MKNGNDLWTIEELNTRVALALSVNYDGAASGRVRDVPDVRTIRYYTTLGLLDRAADMRGRTALYSRRHLLQLVAIKRLQADGLPLGDIQQRLVGLSNARLARLARIPDEPLIVERVGAAASPAAPEPADEERERFWAAAPAEPLRAANPPAAEPVTLQGVPLDDHVTLLLAADRPLELDDIEALRAAAAPLLELMHTRRLLRPRQKGDLV